MEKPVEQLCNCDVRLFGKEKRVRCVNILISKICHMNFSNESKISKDLFVQFSLERSFHIYSILSE